MKNRLSLIVVCLISYSLSYSQNATQLKGLQTDEYNVSHFLEDKLEHFEVFELKIQKDAFNTGASNIPISIELGNKTFDLNLFPNNIQIDKRSDSTPLLLSGSLNNGGTASLTINDNYIFGYIKNGSSYQFIEPLNYFNAEAPDNLFVLYNAADVIEGHGHQCGVEQTRTKTTEFLQKSNPVNCVIMNLAIADTYDMVTKYGSASAVETHNLAVLNNVQTNFRSEFISNIEFVVVEHYIPSSTSLDPLSPVTTSVMAGTLLDNFRDWSQSAGGAGGAGGGNTGGAQGGFGVDFNMATLWTARDLIGSNNADIVALAYTPGWFHILQDYSSNGASLAAMTTHEIGHNFGAIHDPSGSNTIMTPNVNITPNWSSASETTIENRLGTLNYLSDCSNLGAPIAAMSNSIAAICSGQTLEFEDQSQYGVDRTWTFNGGSISSSVLAKQNVTYNTSGLHAVKIESENNAGSDTALGYVSVQPEPQNQCIPSGTGSAGGINGFRLANILSSSGNTATAGVYENFVCTDIALLDASTTYDVFFNLSETAYVALFLDYNNDGDFNDASESLGQFNIPAGGTYYAPITTIASPEFDKIIRFRIISSENTISNACTNPVNGQVEDFGIYFAAPQVIGCMDSSADNYDPNATIDSGECEYTNSSTWYKDADNDSFGDVNNTINQSSQPSGYVANSTDCNDQNPNIYPGNTEVCDGVDNDCDGAIDENLNSIFYQDSDGDGFGNSNVTLNQCSQPNGYVSNDLDCNDNDPNAYPGRSEICDGIDNNCDGQIDENLSTTFYLDNDGDGFGDFNNSTDACQQPNGYVLNANDCNDNNNLIHPNATESCDSIDNNCDGQIDENGNNLYYQDADNDGFGNVAVTLTACSTPSGYVSNASDCDDTNNQIYPGATEICDGEDNNCNSAIDENAGTTYYRDSDNDGYGDPSNSVIDCGQPSGYVTNSADCNDSDNAVYLDANEICDGIDNDCDGQIDENGLNFYYEDLDGDGFGNANAFVNGCVSPAGYVTNTSDCDDTNDQIYPGAPEVCDNLDNNCDGTVDENGSTIFYLDNDGDGFGDVNQLITSCDPPAGYVSNASDCDDSNDAIYLGATDICDGLDNNCDGIIDENGNTIFYLDSDGDGFGDPNQAISDCNQPNGYVTNAADCDDSNDAIYQGAVDICDGLDNNCDGTIDENGNTTFYLDSDGDGFGDPNQSISDCNQPNGYVTNDADCDDSNDAIYQGAVDICDGLDNNCDGTIDENGNTTFYLDSDGDGFGDPNQSISDCNQPNGYVTNAIDCDDSNDTVYQGAVDICDGLDNNCNGTIDENGNTTFYLDSDGDGFGDANQSISDCKQPNGYVTNDADCDDSNDAIYQGAIDICDGIDNNCDGTIDENGNTTFYLDSDGDGFGDPNQSISDCNQPNGYVTNDADCDDSNDAVYQGAVDICDGIDNNCDGNIDENGNTTFYLDSDSDGFGDANQSISDCNQPNGYVTNNADCDDSNSAIYLGAPDICDGLDNNCDGTIDEEGLSTFYQDNDGDGFGDLMQAVSDCVQPAGYVNNAMDCDDDNENVFQGAIDICDGIDNNCDGIIDENGNITFYQDNDGDGFGNVSVILTGCTPPAGYVSNASDCDDDNDEIYPGASELCDGIDNNCNSAIDENANTNYYQDADGDGFGDANQIITDCSQPIGYVSNSNDCDDNDNSVYPGALDICDGVDNNCDGNIDENGAMTTYYQDSDGDGFGNNNNSIVDCTQPAGFVSNGDDCNDNNSAIHPGSFEDCDNLDNNCNGQIDEICPDCALTVFELREQIVHTNCNDNDGSIIIDPQGGTAPYDIQWSNGSVSMQLDNLPAGEYTLTLTDALGCQLVERLTVQSSSIPECFFAFDLADCDQASTIVTASVLNGSGQYSFEWNNGETTPTVSFSQGGSYTLVTTDLETNCQASQVVEVPEISRACSSIGNYVWDDKDADGIQDDSEPGLEGVLVKLFTNSKSNFIQQTVTDQDGYFIFENLADGEYFLEFNLGHYPSYVPTISGIDLDDFDSNVTEENGSMTTHIITVNKGSDHMDVDGGFYKSANIKGIFWDEGADGIENILDNEDEGLADAEINLYKVENGVESFVRTTTTDFRGHYSLDLLQAGSYIVEFISPSNSEFVDYSFTNDIPVSKVFTFSSNGDITIGRTETLTVVPCEVLDGINAGINSREQVLAIAFSAFSCKWNQENQKTELVLELENRSDLIEFDILRKHENQAGFELIASIDRDEIDGKRLKYEDGEITKSGIYYYQIQAIDLANEIYKTEIKSIQIESEQIGISDIKLYPNPAQQLVRFHWAGDATIQSVVLLNQLGQKIRYNNLTVEENGIYSLDLIGIETGLYYLQILTNQNELIKPLIIID